MRTCHRIFIDILIFLSAVCYSVLGDIYIHVPRGSNDRLNENTRNRKNAKRLFDSQNNNRGGYNAGPQPMYYYPGSKLQLEWTTQHSCGDANSHCELIIQYMCHDKLRDGTTTTTIPLDQTDCKNKDCMTDEQYGMHEDYQSYAECYMRQRNKGLFTADQDMRNRETAINTRQENNGRNNRYGYECPEERDYYPYWHPSDWKDIAVLTKDVRRCAYYKAESENVKSRWGCYFPEDKLKELYDKKVRSIPNNKEDCENFRYPANDENGFKGVWKEFPAHGLPAPFCRETQFTRDNHLGNGVDGNPNRYNWTIPDIVADKCVLRIRYNISTGDYDGWNTNSSYNADNKDQPTKLDLSQKYGFKNYTAAQARGYVFEGDPEVQIFDEGSFNFRLAVDTSQFGRTFQDRSHVFSIKKRPEYLKGAEIYNLNVRGKRGNIVQVYPAVEYDFTPNVLEMPPGAYVHFQWNGADTNPKNNDGQGKAGSDRNNALLLRNKNYPEGNGVQYGPAPTYGHYGNNYPMMLNESAFLGLSKDDLLKLAFLDPGNVDSDLNETSPYFDLGPRKVDQVGTYHYVCTRNNDFTNRDQKARIMVSAMPFTETALGYLGGDITLPNGAGSVHADEGVFDSLHHVRLEVWSRDQGQERVEAAGKELKSGDDYVSDFLVLYPQSSMTLPGKAMRVSLKVEDASNIAVYRSSSDQHFATWTKLDTEVEDGVAHFQASAGGVYVARSHSYTVLIVALIVSALVIVLIVVGGVMYFRRNPKKWNALKEETVNLKKNFKSNV